MKNKIKAIIFDIGGVLSLGKQPISYYNGRAQNLGVHEFIAKKLKISLDQYFDSIDIYYVKSTTGEITEEQTINKIAKNFKITPKKLIKLYTTAYEKHFKVNKTLYKFAFKLKKKGYKIAILSDQWHLSKKSHRLIDQKLMNRFDVVILSPDVKMRKPNPKIYKLTLKKLNLKPSETIFIDNQKWNTEPAKKLGMKTILFKDNKQLFKNKSWQRLWK